MFCARLSRHALRTSALSLTAAGAVALGTLSAGCATSYRTLIDQNAPVEAVRAPDSTPGDDVVFVDIRVFPGDVTTPLEAHDVVVTNGVITAVRPTGEPLPVGHRIVDGAGHTLLPGLVDTHAHVLNPAAAPGASADADPVHNMQAWLYSGVTTVYDLGGFADQTLKLKTDQASGAIAGPTLYRAGMNVTGPMSHPIPLAQSLLPCPLSLAAPAILPQVATPDEARAFVDQMVAADADLIKAIVDDIPTGSPKMQPDTLAALCDAAHQHKLKCFVHTTRAEDAVMAVNAGADVLAHGVVRSALTDAQADAIAKSGADVIYTLAGWQTLVDFRDGQYVPSALMRDMAPDAVLEGFEDTARMKRESETGVFGDLANTTIAGAPHWQANIAKLRARGVTILVGTDAALPGVYPGAAVHEEMAILVAAGMPAAEVLQGATWNAAQALTAEPTFGRIAPGMRGDLLVVHGDPTNNIAASTAIHSVWQGGRAVSRVAR